MWQVSNILDSGKTVIIIFEIPCREESPITGMLFKNK
jgi:hypothetical protein